MSNKESNQKKTNITEYISWFFTIALIVVVLFANFNGIYSPKEEIRIIETCYNEPIGEYENLSLPFKKTSEGVIIIEDKNEQRN